MRAGHLPPALRVVASNESAERSSRRADGRCNPALQLVVSNGRVISYVKPEIGSEVVVAQRRAVVLAAWDGRGGPRNVLVEFVGALWPEKWVVHVSRVRPV